MQAAMITGSQDKLSISGGSMNVSSGGVTQMVNSGEITFITEGSAPTKARKLKRNELKDITDSLSMVNDIRPVNLKYAPVKRKLAKKIARFLVKAGIQRQKITFHDISKEKTYLYVKQIDINAIKNIYPTYYKALSKYYIKNKKRLKSKSKTPTVIVKLNMIKRYHKTLYNRYH
jgi:hypothetical protein